MSAVQDTTWHKQAACLGLVGIIDFYSSDADEVARAKAVCAECPVKSVCLAHAEEFGVWGGLSEQERRIGFKPSCPSCGKPTVNITATQERCLGCGLAWYC